MVAAQVRMDSANFQYTTINAIVDKDGRSLTSIMGKYTATSYASHRIAGTLFLKAGQTLALHFFGSKALQVNIDSESGWGVVKVPDSEAEGYVGTQAGAGFHPRGSSPFGPGWQHFNEEACIGRNVKNSCPLYGGYCDADAAAGTTRKGVYRASGAV